MRSLKQVSNRLITGIDKDSDGVVTNAEWQGFVGVEEEVVLVTSFVLFAKHCKKRLKDLGYESIAAEVKAIYSFDEETSMTVEQKEHVVNSTRAIQSQLQDEIDLMLGITVVSEDDESLLLAQKYNDAFLALHSLEDDHVAIELEEVQLPEFFDLDQETFVASQRDESHSEDPARVVVPDPTRGVRPGSIEWMMADDRPLCNCCSIQFDTFRHRHHCRCMLPLMHDRCHANNLLHPGVLQGAVEVSFVTNA